MLFDPKKEAEIELEIKIAKEPWRRTMLDAIDILNQRGWCKKWEDGEGRRCALGALALAAGEKDRWSGGNYLQAACRLQDYLDQRIDIWNDASDADTVIATLKLVACS